MTISPLAIKDYLARDFNNFDWIKKISEDKLDAEIAKLRPKPNFQIPLWKHQKACFLIGVRSYSNLGFFVYRIEI